MNVELSPEHAALRARARAFADRLRPAIAALDDESRFPAEHVAELASLGLLTPHWPLAVAPGRVFTREDLLAEVWEIRGSVSTRTVDVHVRRLRVSLGAAADWIETVHGFGYRAKREGETSGEPPATPPAT